METKKLTDNDIIAEFMGGTWIPNGIYSEWTFTDGCRHNTLLYERSWDWLMPVVEEISKIDFPKHNEQKYFEFQDRAECVENIQIGHTSIELVYTAVVEFIKWYSNQPQKAS